MGAGLNSRISEYNYTSLALLPNAKCLFSSSGSCTWRLATTRCPPQYIHLDIATRKSVPLTPSSPKHSDAGMVRLRPSTANFAGRKEKPSSLRPYTCVCTHSHCQVHIYIYTGDHHALNTITLDIQKTFCKSRISQGGGG